MAKNRVSTHKTVCISEVKVENNRYWWREDEQIVNYTFNTRQKFRQDHFSRNPERISNRKKHVISGDDLAISVR
jgi:hypothetical protein